MKFGLSITTRYSPGLDPREAVRYMVQRAEAVRDAGFDSLWTGDHHITADGNYFQNLPTITHLIPYAGDMRVGALFLQPLYQPVLLAEQIATLDVLSGGRFTPNFALGYQEDAHAAFQIPWRQRVGRLEEGLEAMRRLWQDNGASLEGRHYRFQDVSINPKPLQQPLPVWIAASAPPAVERAARLGDAWLAAPLLSRQERQEQMAVYRQALDQYSRADGVHDYPIRMDIHLAKDRETARAEVEERFSRGYRGLPLAAAWERTIVDGPQGCIESLREIEADGYDYVLFRFMSPRQAKVLEAARLLKDEVVPALRR
ncbi:MAG: LLM class flavin-dependent oxidoreductase [Dehalococcoidia bacterium]